MDQDFIRALRTAFSSEYSFLVKAQDAHWNVQGDEFYQDHLLFETIYQEVEESIDPFAEQLRQCQIFVPSGLAKMKALSILDDFPADDLTCDVYKQILLTDSDNLADLFASAFALAEQNKEHGLSNFLADRQAAHRKHSWMLRASLVVEPGDTN
jgi:starvation-inducible DNA-binding protein